MNAFTLFGEIKADTGAFEKSLYDSNKRLLETEKALDKVVDKSIELGDTSATVGRRYEKLNEQIAAQKTRLLDAAVAYEKNDITAKQYATTVISVHKQVDTLTARIKDAAARTRELDETGLTHFQNQIKGATSAVQDNINTLLAARQAASSVTVQNKSNDLFGNLSGFQKKQLSFQANDVITGLLSGQPITQILAQQGGQIVQVFQQGKSAAEGTAVAANAAAVAETKFAASAQTAAIAQGEVAAASQATAAATTEGAAAMTVFGVALVPIATLLAAGVVTILAAKKATEDILKTAKDRLAAEEAVAGALNKQYLAAKALKEELASQNYDSQFSQYLKSAGDGPTGISVLQKAQADLQRQYDANQKSVNDEITRRAAEADQQGLTGGVRTKFLGGAVPSGFSESQKGLESQIKGINEQVNQLRSALPSTVDVYQKQLDDLVKAQAENNKVIQKAAEDRKQLIAQQNQEETALLKSKYSVQEAQLKLYLQTTAASQAKSIIATTALQTQELDAQLSSTKRYYNALIANAQTATERQQAESNKRIAIAQLESQKQIAAINKVIQLQEIASTRFSTGIQIGDLRTQAKEFQQGYLNPKGSVSDDLQRKLDSIQSGLPLKTIVAGYASGGGLGGHASELGGLSPIFKQIRDTSKLSALDQQKFDAEVIKATNGLNPADLTEGQRNLAATARQREADRLQTGLKDAIDELNKNVKSGSIVHIVDDSNGKAKVENRPTSATTANFYPSN
jgi:hypothetical protein